VPVPLLGKSGTSEHSEPSTIKNVNDMSRVAHRLLCSAPAKLQRLSRCTTTSRREFSTSRAIRAHGVFAGIASSRMTTPWIDAYNHQHEKGDPQPAPARDMSPKKMSDSYHKMVRLDTVYLNKSLSRIVTALSLRRLNFHHCASLSRALRSCDLDTPTRSRQMAFRYIPKC